MHARRAWVLLLLAAVFAMHGLQCVTADTGPSAGMHGTLHLSRTDARQVLHLTGVGPVMASAGAVIAAPLDTAHAAAVTVLPSAGGHDSAPRGVGHLWALCLAVLAAGLAVLIVLAGRPAKLVPSLPRPTHGSAAGWLRPPRPPDLYSLCLMRI